jgi:hypothetical protein
MIKSVQNEAARLVWLTSQEIAQSGAKERQYVGSVVLNVQ